jgi:NhaP-type Na+/H+ or K+/H+ antiporter/polyhydroxyalkanoate synthesis regulator phasin
MANKRHFIRNRIIWILCIAFLFVCYAPSFLHAQEHQDEHVIQQHNSTETEVVASESAQHHNAEAEHEEGGHDSHANMLPLFFIIMALFIGTATRHFLRRSPLPYTVTLLIIGILLGVLARLGYFDIWHIGSLELNVNIISHAIGWAGNIDPHAILYVFLPTLIFEAAFAMDVHTFRKSAGNAFLLAVPGIVIAMVLTALLCMGIAQSGLGLSKWSWTVALMFGILISANDPVAVVALLKELGTSKKLRTLIESESLLNDGTAIVIFMVFFLMLTGNSSDTPVILEFIRVAVGGVLLGVVVGLIVIRWIKKVFNDALFEITTIISAAYLTFYVAEHFFHVSGVLGLVALGLLMAGQGRTRISPEVGHFLHEFWELAAFIANTLIFIIVGVIISLRAVFTTKDFLILAIIYIGIQIVRAIVIIVFYPLMRRIGYGVTVKDSIILVYSALRGAIGLALALIVQGAEQIDPEIRHQILFMTAGIVTLTSLINATTIKYIVKGLGLTKLSSAKALMMVNANNFIRQSSESAIEKFKKDRFMSGADWTQVEEYLPKTMEEEEVEQEKIAAIAEKRKRLLQREKSSYWRQFEEGLLGRDAVHKLSDTMDEMLDSEGLISLAERKDLELLWQTPKMLNILQNMPLIGKFAQKMFFERLFVGYDSARGFVRAQEDTMKLLKSMAIADDEEGMDTNIYDSIEDEINENRIQGLTFLRNLRDAFPEIYNAIETRQATRSLLNHQQNTVDRMLKQGKIDNEEAAKILEHIEEQMKEIMNFQPTLKMTVSKDALKKVPWVKDIEEEELIIILNKFRSRIYAVGEHLIKKGKNSNDIFIIVRGSVKVMDDQVVKDIFGPGDTVGEMAPLTGIKRTATVTAESPVTSLRLPAEELHLLMNNNEKIATHFWMLAGTRFAENMLGQMEPYNNWTHSDLQNWLLKGKIFKTEAGHTIETNNQVTVLLSGVAASTEGAKSVMTYNAPALIKEDIVIAKKESIFFVRKEE